MRRALKSRQRADSTKANPDEHLTGFHVAQGPEGLVVTRQVRGPDRYRADVRIHEAGMTPVQLTAVRDLIKRFDW